MQWSVDSDWYLAAWLRAGGENSIGVLPPVARHTAYAATSYEKERQGRRNMHSCLYTNIRYVMTTLLIYTTSTIHISDK